MQTLINCLAANSLLRAAATARLLLVCLLAPVHLSNLFSSLASLYPASLPLLLTCFLGCYFFSLPAAYFPIPLSILPSCLLASLLLKQTTILFISSYLSRVFLELYRQHWQNQV